MTIRTSQFFMPQMVLPSLIDHLLESINDQNQIQFQVQEKSLEIQRPKNELMQSQTSTLISYLGGSPSQEFQDLTLHSHQEKDSRVKTNCKNVLQNIKNPIVKYLENKGYNPFALNAFKDTKCNQENFINLFKDPQAQFILSEMFRSKYLKRQYFLSRCPQKNKITHLYRIRELQIKFIRQVKNN